MYIIYINVFVCVSFCSYCWRQTFPQWATQNEAFPVCLQENTMKFLLRFFYNFVVGCCRYYYFVVVVVVVLVVFVAAIVAFRENFQRLVQDSRLKSRFL